MEQLDKKKIVIFLTFLTNSTLAEKVTLPEFNEYVHDLGFDELLNNADIFHFYNKVIMEPEIIDEFSKNGKIDWNKYGIDDFKINFIGKINLIKNKFPPENVFDKQIDDYFVLGFRNTNSSSKGNIDFESNYIRITFENYGTKFFKNLLNLEDGILDIYYRSKYDSSYGYRPEKDDLKYMINHYFNDENKEKTNIILRIIGQPTISFDSEEETEEILIKSFDDIFGEKIFNDIFNEYAGLIQINSSDKIEEEFKQHVNSVEGVKMVDEKTIDVTYDFLIRFLMDKPEIETFYDLKNYEFIDYTLTHEGLFEDIYGVGLTNEDEIKMNNEIENALDKILYDHEEELEIVSNTLEKFKRIIRDLKFIDTGSHYEKDIRDYGKFLIERKNIDFLTQKLQLNFIGINGEEKNYKISFDDVGSYVTNYKLIENLIKRIKNKLFLN